MRIETLQDDSTRPETIQADASRFDPSRCDAKRTEAKRNAFLSLLHHTPRSPSTVITFDLETGPLDDEILAQRIPQHEPPPPPGGFNPGAVKLGNTKDPAKVKEKIEAAREKHQAEVKQHEQKVAEEKAGWFEKHKSRAALNPLTGQILAIGYLSTDSGKSILDHIDTDRTEAAMLVMFWKQYERCRTAGRILVGHNIYIFDLPMAVGRSWLLGIDVPPTVIERGKYLDSRVFIDTMARWCAVSKQKYISLDALARLFGVGGKPDGIDGSMFAGLFETNRKVALDYLQNDLELTRGVAERMGLL